MSQEAQVLVFASQKGGSGKTTLSGHIAVQAELAGAGPVALIDTDPQGSLAKWWNARDAEEPAFARVSVPDLARDIEALKASGFRLIVIDTPPAVTSSIAEVVTFADLVVIPTRPSPHDLRAVGPTVDICQLQQKPLMFVVNAATARARITGETAVALSQHGTVAPVTLHHRVDYAASMIDGRTVCEVDANAKSSQEIAALWSYLADRLMRMRGTEDALASPRPTFEDDLLTPFRAGDRRSAGRDDDEEEELEEAPLPVAASAKDAVEGTPWREQRRIHKEAALKATNGAWDGIDRRKKDGPPPAGLPDRRTRQVSFGRRGLQ